jgi:hypothetical protein
LTSCILSGSALKPMRIHNTALIPTNTTKFFSCHCLKVSNPELDQVNRIQD